MSGVQEMKGSAATGEITPLTASIERRGDVFVRVDHAGGCAPATAFEVELWLALERKQRLLEDAEALIVRQRTERLRLEAALAEKESPVKYGCHIDLDELSAGAGPDECVIDTGRYDDCMYARRYGADGRQHCGEWKPIKLVASDAGGVSEGRGS